MRLVDHDAGIRQGEALADGARRQQEGTHAGGEARAQGGYVRLDELHRVVDRHAGIHRAARRIDVERNVLVRIVRFQEQQLGDDQVGRLLGHFADQEDTRSFSRRE
jgi:hypothetical protein